MKKTFFIVMVIVVIVATATMVSCDSQVSDPMKTVIAEDSRNSGIEIDAHYKGMFDKSVLVLDVKSIDGNKSPADVFRVLLQYAQKMKETSFETVQLASKGKIKFYIKGDYFRKLGVEFGVQNPIYTMRTFPENVFKPDGSRAFATWTGGVLGVTGKQMEDFSAFHKQWYIEDL